MQENQKLKVSFKIQIYDEWVPIEPLIYDPDQLLIYYLELENLTSSEMKGGFFIEADGVLWNDGYVDEFQMTETWFDALEKLLNGAQSAEVWVWEDSNLTLTRHGNSIILEDIHSAGKLICPEVSFDFHDFVSQFLQESRKFALLINQMLEAIRPLENSEVMAGSIQINNRVETIKDNLPKELDEKINLMEVFLEDF